MLCILYVEDNGDNAYMLKMRLKLTDEFEVLVAEDGEKADTFQERQRLVVSERQHAVVEIELGELPVEVARLNLGRGRPRRRPAGIAF